MTMRSLHWSIAHGTLGSWLQWCRYVYNCGLDMSLHKDAALWTSASLILANFMCIQQTQNWRRNTYIKRRGFKFLLLSAGMKHKSEIRHSGNVQRRSLIKRRIHELTTCRRYSSLLCTVLDTISIFFNHICAWTCDRHSRFEWGTPTKRNYDCNEGHSSRYLHEYKLI